MKRLILLFCLLVSGSACYSANCSVLENKMLGIDYKAYTPANYQRNLQQVNNFYDNGCKRSFESGKAIDRNYDLGLVAFVTSDNTSEKAKYLQYAYNYFLKTKVENGGYASQAALKLGYYYRDKGLYDNAIIWYQRAADKLRQQTGSSGYIPVHMADAYVLKGNCSSQTFDLYRKGMSNFLAVDDYAMAEKIANRMEQAHLYCQ